MDLKHKQMDNVVDYIWWTKNTLILQRAWRRRDLYRHTRVSKNWNLIKPTIYHHRQLILYKNVRIEWMSDPYSWYNIPENTASEILNECQLGMWGYKTKLYW